MRDVLRLSSSTEVVFSALISVCLYLFPQVRDVTCYHSVLRYATVVLAVIKWMTLVDLYRKVVKQTHKHQITNAGATSDAVTRWTQHVYMIVVALVKCLLLV